MFSFIHSFIYVVNLANKIAGYGSGAGYFIKQSVLHVFSNSGYAWWVTGWPETQLDTTAQEGVIVDYDQVQYRIQAMQVRSHTVMFNLYWWTIKSSKK